MLCDKCGEAAYYGEPVIGFVAGKVHCVKCAIGMIRTYEAEEVE